MAKPRHRGKVGAKLVSQGDRHVTFDEWIDGNGGQNAKMYATREQVVSYSQFQFREQMIPFMAELIKNAIDGYEKKLHARRWSTRLWVALKGLVVRKSMSVEDLPEEARDQLREQLDAMDRQAGGKEGPAPAEPGAEVAPEPEPAVEAGPTSCVVCASRDLGPVSEFGGTKCNKCGAVLEDPPLAIVPGKPEPKPDVLSFDRATPPSVP